MEPSSPSSSTPGHASSHHHWGEECLSDSHIPSGNAPSALPMDVFPLVQHRYLPPLEQTFIQMLRLLSPFLGRKLNKSKPGNNIRTIGTLWVVGSFCRIRWWLSSPPRTLWNAPSTPPAQCCSPRSSQTPTSHLGHLLAPPTTTALHISFINYSILSYWISCSNNFISSFFFYNSS